MRISFFGVGGGVDMPKEEYSSVNLIILWQFFIYVLSRKESSPHIRMTNIVNISAVEDGSQMITGY